jgi:hypothetical protein
MIKFKKMMFAIVKMSVQLTQNKEFSVESIIPAEDHWKSPRETLKLLIMFPK